MAKTAELTCVSLFAGIGGIDLGAQRAGARSVLLVENWEPALRVLSDRFPQAAVQTDVRDIHRLPEADLVTAGFPCTDLSPAGRTAGIHGLASSLVFTALDLIESSRPAHVLLENVPNMLHLSRGAAMAAVTERFDEMGYRWAYRVIDSRAFGVPQRRRRVFLLASRLVDPAAVLLSSSERPVKPRRVTGYGFYWTEGNRGVGWGEEVLPTLKGSSTANVPSPPAVWVPDAPLGWRIVRPSIDSVERAQGLPAGWTRSAPERTRWKLVGNAVTPAVAEWIVRRLSASDIGSADQLDARPLKPGAPWPGAAFSRDGKVWRVDAGDHPVRRHRLPVGELLDRYGAEPLSLRATEGFLNRLERSSLRTMPEFRADLRSHVAVLRAQRP